MARAMAWVSSAGIAIIMFLTGADVVSRYLVRHPIKGTIDLTIVLIIVVGFLAFGYAQVFHQHITVDIVTSKLSQRTKAILNTIMYFLASGAFALMAWGLGEQVWKQITNPVKTTTTPLLLIPMTPFFIVGAVGVLIMFLVVVADFFKYLVSAIRK